MKKILFLINTLGVGGAESVLVNTVNSLDCEKYRITVQTITDTGEYVHALSPSVEYRSVIRIKNRALRDLVSKLLLKLCSARLIYDLFIKADHDIEIAFLEGQPTRILAQSTSKKAKRYAWVHTDIKAFPDSMYAYGSEEKEGAAYRSFDRVFCVSECVKTAIVEKYGLPDDKVGVVYNIMNDATVCKAAEETSDLIVKTRPMLITVGRLVEQKGYERLLCVHKRLICEGLAHTLVIIGDGERREALEAYIEQNHLSDTAILLGYKSNPHKYVKDADLFVCSSVVEGYSTVVGEAVLCGTPVLSTDVAGAREPLDRPRCSIVVDNDEEALYAELRSLLSNPEELAALREDLEARKVVLRKEYLLSAFERNVLEQA